MAHAGDAAGAVRLGTYMCRVYRLCSPAPPAAACAREVAAAAAFSNRAKHHTCRSSELAKCCAWMNTNLFAYARRWLDAAAVII